MACYSPDIHISVCQSNLKEIKSYNEDLSKQSSKPSIASTEGESDDSLDRWVCLGHVQYVHTMKLP